MGSCLRRDSLLALMQAPADAGVPEEGAAEFLVMQLRNSSLVGQLARVFNRCLRPTNLEGRAVYSLGPGLETPELFAINKYLEGGHRGKSPLVAIDTAFAEKPDTSKKLAEYTGAHILSDDLRRIDPESLFKEYGKPGLIFIRAPRIAELFDSRTGKMVTFNEWPLEVIPNWLKHLPPGGKAFLSTYSVAEANLLDEALKNVCSRSGFAIKRYENSEFTPVALQRRCCGKDYLGPERVIFIVRNKGT